MHDAYGLTIFQRPDGLGSGNNWPVGTFDSINESSRDDADFITSSGLRQNQQDTVIFSLSDAVDPIVDIDHIVRYTFRENGLSAAHSPSLEVTLQQGATDLITWTESGPLPNTFTLSTREVPTSVVGQIGNYNDLRLKFRVFCQAGATCDNSTPEETISISWAELQYETYTTPRDHVQPKISGIGFYKIVLQNQTVPDFIKLANYSKYSDVTDKQNYGKYAKSGKYYDIGKPIPTFESKINEPIQVQVKLDGVFASTRIEHLSLISTNAKSDPKSPNFEIIADKGKKTIVIDHNKIFKDVKSEYSREDASLWVNFDLVFQKPLKKSNILLQVWDEMRRPVYSELVDVWEITDPAQNVAPVVEIPDRVKVAITKKVQTTDCTSHDCFVPTEITIRKGGSIVWKNEDSILHTIVSGTPTKGPDGRFNFALIPQQSSEKVFYSAGTFPYYCSIHPWYVGTVIVSDSKESKLQQFVDFNVRLPSGKTISNEQTVTLKDRNSDVVISGHLPNILKPTPVSIQIIKPDGSADLLSVKTTRDGDYYTLTKLAKKWQTGKFEIISKHKGVEVGHINFTVSDVPIKKQNSQPSDIKINNMANKSIRASK